jgi:hypothetical protein
MNEYVSFQLFNAGSRWYKIYPVIFLFFSFYENYDGSGAGWVAHPGRGHGQVQLIR